MTWKLAVARRTAAIAVASLLGGTSTAIVALGGTVTLREEPREPTTFRETLAHLEDLSGRRWGSERLAGKVVLVDFWATWCAPCRAEVPTLRTAYRRFRERGFQIIGVALDPGERRDLESWLRRQRVTWPQIHERRGLDSPVARHFGVESLPRSFLLDRRGRRVATNLRGDALLAVLSALFSEARGPSPASSLLLRDGPPLSLRGFPVALAACRPVPSRTTSSAF